MNSGRFGKRRFGKNMAADVSAKKNLPKKFVEKICRNVSNFFLPKRPVPDLFPPTRLKNPVLPRPPAEKCIHCLLIRDTSQFYALQPRWKQIRYSGNIIMRLKRPECKSVEATWFLSRN